VRVPDQYADFLDNYGIYHAPGIEVFGMSNRLSDYDGMPCVIGATKIRRTRHFLAHRYLVLYYTGTEDEFVCLDTEDERVYSVSWVFGNRKIADSFDEWFQRDILEASSKANNCRQGSDENI
jgi:hypothetical protein